MGLMHKGKGNRILFLGSEDVNKYIAESVQIIRRANLLVEQEKMEGFVNRGSLACYNHSDFKFCHYKSMLKDGP